MWKLIVLVALVATARGEDYTERLTRSMNEAVNSRCGYESTEGYTGTFTEIESGYDYDTLKIPFDQASTTIAGLCIYNQARTHVGETRVTSIQALMEILSLLTSFANTSQLTTELYNLINFDDNEQVRFFVPKYSDKIANEESDGFSSTLKLMAYTSSDNGFSENFKSSIAVINGEAKELDYSNPEQVAEEINEGHPAPVVTVEDVESITGVVFSSTHDLQITLEDFALTKSVISEDESKRPSVWVGEGLAKAYYNEIYDAQVLQFKLKGDLTATVVQPKARHVIDYLFQTRDYKSFASVMDDSVEFEHIKLTFPMYESICGSEDYVDGLKLVNQMSAMYYPGYTDLLGVLINGSGHVSHMYHKMCITLNNAEGTGTTYYSDSPTEYVMDTTYMVYICNPDGTQKMSALVVV